MPPRVKMFWGEIGEETCTSHIPIKIPDSVKSTRPRPRAETLISGNEAVSFLDPVTCPHIRQRLNLPLAVPAVENQPIKMQLDYEHVNKALLHGVLTLSLLQGFDAVDREVLDSLVDLAKLAIESFGEECHAMQEKAALKMPKNARFAPEDYEKILDKALKNAAVHSQGLDGLSAWYRENYIKQYEKTELIVEHTPIDGLVDLRRENAKGNSQKLDKPHVRHSRL